MPEYEIDLPIFHEDQVRAFNLDARFKAVRCGRRWGKTLFGETIGADAVINGCEIGWFAPKHKFMAEAYNDIYNMLQPIVKHSNKMEGFIRLLTGGRMDFWSLHDDPNAGRSRKYHGVIIDEAAFTGPGALDTWKRSIRPTLLDYRGWALVLSNTNGIDAENLFWAVCNDADLGFVEYHAPSHNNPYLPKEELDEVKLKSHPLVYQQEYLAEFVDFSGVAFFSKEKHLVNNEPVPLPIACDAVYVTIDTALKTKMEHDGAAVIYWALDKTKPHKHALTVLDWDIQQIEGGSLEHWLPSVFHVGNYYAKTCGARFGFMGAHIEDKTSGTILLQQAQKKGQAAYAIDSVLTSLGKDERALSVSGYAYQGLVKMAEPAYSKNSLYKGHHRNHFMSQVFGFRIGTKDPHAEDDLLDCYCYGVAIGLGDNYGI